MSVALAVICKAPVPGRVKTRLCPPCTHEQAATIAEAALRDTLLAVANTPAARYVCVLDGEPGPWLPEGFEVIPQRGDGLDQRLAAAFEAMVEPTFLVGMDTPQITPALLMHAGDALLQPGTDAVLGHTFDGGYWGIGLRKTHNARDLFEGVPMSQDDTGAHQLERLLSNGLAVNTGLPHLIDVDDIEAAELVAEQAPATRFAGAVRRLNLDNAVPPVRIKRPAPSSYATGARS